MYVDLHVIHIYIYYSSYIIFGSKYVVLVSIPERKIDYPTPEDKTTPNLISDTKNKQNINVNLVF